MLVGERDCLLRERRRVELVRRHVREVARAIRPLRQERGSLGGGAQLRRLEVPDDDVVDRLGRPFSLVFQRPGEYPPMIVPSTSAAAWSASETSSRSSSCQHSVPPTRESSFAAAAPAVRSASRSTSSRLPTPTPTMRVPPTWTSTASPRSPRSSPVAASSASRPSRPSSGGCVTGTARASAFTCSGSAMSIVTPMAGALEELLELHRSTHVALRPSASRSCRRSSGSARRR